MFDEDAPVEGLGCLDLGACRGDHDRFGDRQRDVLISLREARFSLRKCTWISEGRVLSSLRNQAEAGRLRRFGNLRPCRSVKKRFRR